MCFIIFILDKKVVGSSPTRGSKAKSLNPSQLATWLGFLLLNFIKYTPMGINSRICSLKRLNTS